MKLFRCIIFSISILFLFSSCSKKNDEIIFIYKTYNMNNKYLGEGDTLSLLKIKDSLFIASIYLNGYKKTMNVEQRYNQVAIINKDKNNILFNTENDSIYANPEYTELNSPYLVKDSKLLQSKQIIINSKRYQVHLFIINNHSTINSFVIYSSEFGFLAYTEKGNNIYKKLVDIINLPSDRKKIALELANEILKDSLFFPYPIVQKPVPMKFSIPK